MPSPRTPERYRDAASAVSEAFPQRPSKPPTLKRGSEVGRFDSSASFWVTKFLTSHSETVSRRIVNPEFMGRNHVEVFPFFLSARSSTVEQPALNREVEGANPSGPTDDPFL